MARLIVVEPWYSGSHRAWADGLVQHSRHDIELVTLGGAFWRWRLRGSAVTLADRIETAVADEGPPDAVVVSSMTDLARLLGLARRSLGGIPAALYLHENQVAFPARAANTPTTDHAFVTWASMCAADVVWCNSDHHRDALFGGLVPLLADAPDDSHLGRLDGLRESTSVLPVGVELAGVLDGERSSAFDRGGGPPLIVWNQRWDHDKDPARFLGIVVKLAEAGVEFEVALAGENRRVDPREFDDAIRRLGDRVVHVGFLDRAAYVELLLRSDVICSTARHEFFGISIIEAIAAGAVPLLPARLSYPEIIPEWSHGPVLYSSGLFDRLRGVLTDLGAARAAVDGLRETMGRYDWSQVAPAYDTAIDTLLG